MTVLPALIPSGADAPLPPPGPPLTPPTVTAKALCACCDCEMPGDRPAIELTITNPNVGNLVGPADASFEGTTGSAVGATCLLSSSTEFALDGTHSLQIRFDGTGAESECSVLLGPYPLSPSTLYTVMANLLAGEVDCAVEVALQFFDILGDLLGEISASGTDEITEWLTEPGLTANGTSPPATDHGYVKVALSGLPPALEPPDPVTVTPQGTTGSTPYGYKVTSTNALGESLPSPEGVTATGNASLSGTNYNALSWGAVTDATGYVIYRGAEPTCAELAAAFATCADVLDTFSECVDLFTLFFGSFLEIGTASGTTFDDTGLTAAPPGPPTENTTGVSHFLDEVGVMDGVAAAWTITPPGSITVLRGDGNYVRGASPLFPLVIAADESVTILDYDAPYGLDATYTAAVTAGTASSGPSVPTAPVEMGQAPDTCQLYRRLGWAKDKDESRILLRWLSGIGEMLQTVDSIGGPQVLADGSVAPGWTQVLDVNRCPTEILPWLGQFVGARFAPTLRDDEQRYLIENSPGWARGTPAAILAAANRFLLPGYAATLLERDTSPYHLTIEIPDAGVEGDATCLALSLAYPSCASLPPAFDTCADLWRGTAAVIASIEGAIPAGLVAELSFV